MRLILLNSSKLTGVNTTKGSTTRYSRYCSVNLNEKRPRGRSNSNPCNHGDCCKNFREGPGENEITLMLIRQMVVGWYTGNSLECCFSGSYATMIDIVQAY